MKQIWFCLSLCMLLVGELEIDCSLFAGICIVQTQLWTPTLQSESPTEQSSFLDTCLQCTMGCDTNRQPPTFLCSSTFRTGNF